ncbi:hypothetical protein [Tautonia rosea]|uniref:hypothetical protein n=1 Tax=Tautonia rosea TaxID=2728037 RepID=UPI0014741519|nr:hypothetical protein [Tautonia rosea]
MCNAWNHHADCSCGFGGENYSTSTTLTATGGLTSYERYLNPFARCPVCQAPVFFYQDTNGGRVFFDELGPPWPKHPCTDHSTSGLAIPIDRSLRRPPDAPPPDWAREGWLPFILVDVSLPNGDWHYCVAGTVLSEDNSYYVSIRMDARYMRGVSKWATLWQPTDPTFYRRSGEVCEVSGITKRDKIREFLLKGTTYF